MHAVLGVLLPVVATALAEPCTDPRMRLACEPVVDLRPATDNYWRRWHQATTAVMAGRGASTIYRDPASQLDAYWRIAGHDRVTPWFDEEDAARARDLAWFGTSLGLERMLRETFERSEVLGVLYRIGSTTTGANLEIRGRARDPEAGRVPDPADPDAHPHQARPALRYNAEPAALRSTQATIEDDAVAPRNGRTPSLRTGIALQVVDGDETEEGLDPDLALTGYTDLRHLGVDALRLQVSESLPEAKAADGSLPAVTGDWAATLRQGLAPRLDLVTRVQGSEEQGWLPTRALGGLAVRLPTRNSWTVRAELTRRFPYEDLEQGLLVEPEWRGMLYLRANTRWTLPQAWDGWPLGREPGSVGRSNPEVPGVPSDG